MTKPLCPARCQWDRRERVVADVATLNQRNDDEHKNEVASSEQVLDRRQRQVARLPRRRETAGRQQGQDEGDREERQREMRAALLIEEQPDQDDGRQEGARAPESNPPVIEAAIRFANRTHRQRIDQRDHGREARGEHEGRRQQGPKAAARSEERAGEERDRYEAAQDPEVAPSSIGVTGPEWPGDRARPNRKTQQDRNLDIAQATFFEPARPVDDVDSQSGRDRGKGDRELPGAARFTEPSRRGGQGPTIALWAASCSCKNPDRSSSA